MAQISTADFKNGMTLDLDDGLFTLVEFQHVKPGKGHAFVRTKLKNVRTGAVLERTMRSGEKMERAIVDKNEMSMLYRDGADFVFMDSNTYEQLHVPPETVGDAADYLADNSTAVVVVYGDEIIHERHRHRYEFNCLYEKALTDKGLRIVGRSLDGKFVEIVELPDHPFYLASQFHPELKSTVEK